MKGRIMRTRNIFVFGVAATTLVGSTIAFSGTAHAATRTTTIRCTSSITHHHSVTSKGTVKDYTLRKSGCGKNYTEDESGITEYASGARSWYVWAKVESYPCWTKTETRVSVSAKGSITTTATRSGNC